MPKVGYSVPLLIESIQNFLGWNNTRDTFAVRVGSLGTALLRFDGFAVKLSASLAVLSSKLAERLRTESVGRKLLKSM